MTREPRSDPSAGVSVRVDRAREQVVEARRAARLARIDAASALRARAVRRTRLLRSALIGVGVVLIVAAITAGVLAWQLGSSRDQQKANDDVLAAADDAVVVMLSADPAAADTYVEAVREVSTGRQLERIDRARGELVAAVAGQPGRSVGQVITSGLITEPDDEAPDSGVEVLLVADATNPLLFGGAPAAPDVDPTGERLTVVLTMQPADGTWKVAEARRA